MVRYRDVRPDADSLPRQRVVELPIAIAEALRPALAAVLGNHLETDTAVVVEGVLDEPVPGPACRDAG